MLQNSIHYFFSYNNSKRYVKRYTYLKMRKCFASVLLCFVVLTSTCFELKIVANPFCVEEVLQQSSIKESDLKEIGISKCFDVENQCIIDWQPEPEGE